MAEFDAGVHQIGKKIVEEAAEVWMAAEYEGDTATAEEISQLLYHLQVLMLAKGLTPRRRVPTSLIRLRSPARPSSTGGPTSSGPDGPTRENRVRKCSA